MNTYLQAKAVKLSADLQESLTQNEQLTLQLTRQNKDQIILRHELLDLKQQIIKNGSADDRLQQQIALLLSEPQGQSGNSHAAAIELLKTQLRLTESQNQSLKREHQQVKVEMNHAIKLVATTVESASEQTARMGVEAAKKLKGLEERIGVAARVVTEMRKAQDRLYFMQEISNARRCV